MNSQKSENYIRVRQISGIHYDIAYKLSDLMNHYYYHKLVEKNNRPLRELFFHYDKFIWKPEFFNYIIFYNVYCLSYYLSDSHMSHLLSVFHLNLFYILYLLENIQTEKYKYKPLYDKNLLQNIAFSLLQYIILMKLKISDDYNGIYKMIYYGSMYSFQSLIKINETYIKRIENIIKEKEKDKDEDKNKDKNKDEDEHKDNIDIDDFMTHFPENLLILTSDIKLIKKVIDLTKHFTFSNFLFYISFLILFVV